MNITKEQLTAMVTSFDMSFQDAFNSAPSTYEKYCMRVGDSAHQIVQLPFMENFAFMRKWIGPRQIKNLQGKTITMKEDGYEDTIGIPVRAIETDNWRMYAISISQLGANGKALWDRLAVDALCTPSDWVDGKAFFATDRKFSDGKRSSVICNKTTSALANATYKTGRQTMLAYCGHNGEPLGVVPDTLMVGPALEDTAWHIINDQYEIDATGKVTVMNSAKGTCEVVMNPRLVGDYAKYWFLMSTKGPIKPVAIQISREAKLTSLNQPTDEMVFMEGQALYGVDAFGSSAPVMPHLVYGGFES